MRYIIILAILIFTTNTSLAIAADQRVLTKQEIERGPQTQQEMIDYFDEKPYTKPWLERNIKVADEYEKKKVRVDWYIDLIGGLIFTWGLGLSPALIARYAVVKRQLSKSSAYLIAGGFSFVFVVLSHLLQISQGMRPTSHSVWILVGWASYWIMRREAVAKQAPINTVIKLDANRTLQEIIEKYSGTHKELIWGGLKKLSKQKHFKNNFSRSDPSQLRVQALSLVCTYCLNEINSGRHHLYRGVLNPVGKAIRNLYIDCVDELLEIGHFTLDAAEESKLTIVAITREVG